MKKIVLVVAYIFTGLALNSCSPRAEVGYLPPAPPVDKVVDGDGDDTNSEGFDPKADILFVVDNSGSMGDHQTNLANNISLFTSTFLEKSIIDYNIAVINTDNGGIYTTGFCCGKFVGETKIISKTTLRANYVLRQNLLVGINGSGEESPFGAVLNALSPALLQDWNSGFLRNDAALIVVFITDAEDQSDASAQELYDYLLRLKNGRKHRLLAYGALVPTIEVGCRRDEDRVYPRKIEQFLSMVPNAGRSNVFSLCDEQFGAHLAGIATEIVNQVSSTVYLTRFPDLETIQVVYGNLTIPQDEKKGWVYDRSLNAIRLGPDIDWTVQPVGTKLIVTYKSAIPIEER